MEAFLKKHWPLFALFLAIGAILYLIMALDRAQDEGMAQIIADRAVARHRAGREAIIAKYGKLYAAKDQEGAQLKEGWDGEKLNVRAWKVRAMAEAAKVTSLQGCREQLNLRINEAGFFNEILISRGEGWMRWAKSKLVLKDEEILAWRIRDEASTNTIGQLTKRVVMLTMAKRKRLVVGPQAGYNPMTKEAYIGFGGTYDIGLRFKVPGL